MPTTTRLSRIFRALCLFIFVGLLVVPVPFADAQKGVGSVEKTRKSASDLFKQYDEALVKSKEDGIQSQESHTGSSVDILQTVASDSIIGQYPNSAVSSISRAIAGMYSMPAAGTETYLADLFNSAGMTIAPPAYAQGIGFAALDPILNAWKTFRNVAYLFFVVVFLVIGFMIMFRQRVSGQMVVTAQQAIPHMIIALIFVTFSYAIAGLMIDAMYLIMFLLISIFNKDGGAFTDGNILMTGFKFTTFGPGAAAGRQALESFVQSILGDGAISDGVSFLGSITATVIVSIAILIGIFGLFFELLKTYISIIISIVLSPLILMLGALPGSNAFWPWFKGLFGNLMAFPTVLLVFIIFDELTGAISQNTTTTIEQGGFSPPYLMGIQGAGLISFIVGLGMLMIIKDLVVQAKKAFGAGGGPFEQFGQAFGDSVRKGWTGGELIPGQAWSDTGRYGVSGRNITGRMYMGTKESNEAANKEQPIRGFMGRGLIGEGWQKAKDTYAKRGQDALSHHEPHITPTATGTVRRDTGINKGRTIK